MGLADRDYARRPPPGGGYSTRIPGGGPRFWSVSTWLIVINVALFVVASAIGGRGSVGSANTLLVGFDEAAAQFQGEKRIVGGFRPTGRLRPYASRLVVDAQSSTPVGLAFYDAFPDPLFAWGHFSTFRGFQLFEVWRLVTFQFLHANLMHLFFNMLGIFFFGRVVEGFLGRKRFAAYYLACGIAGGLLYLILNAVAALGLDLPGALHVDTRTPLIGASAGVYGIIMAGAFIEPRRTIQLLFPPIPLQMRTFAYALVAISFFFLLTGGSNQGGEAAHVGGALAGYFLIRRPHLLRDFFDVFGNSNLPKKPRRGGRARSSSEIDRILDKIQNEGIHSLSEREKKTLERASADKRAGRA